MKLPSGNAKCHDIGEDARNKLGPTLNGLDGRKAGTVDGYDYSEANKNFGIIWSEASFKEYIEDPARKIPGMKLFSSKTNRNRGPVDLSQTVRKWTERRSNR